MKRELAQAARQVVPFQSAGGAQIFQIPLEEFPGFWGYVYVVLVEDKILGPLRVLIDTGSGYGDSNNQLEAGLAAVSAQLGQPFGFGDLTHVLITHGHIDHFGGLTYVQARTAAKVGIHELDRRILTHYEERLLIVARRLDEFLIEAGVSESLRERLLQMYLMPKSIFRSAPVDFTYEAIGMRLGPLRFLHVPGHCAGHVVIRLDDVLFSGDHILAKTSPHQSPEHLTLSTGLDHY
ncbi:MAG TPA: MBL fold metallo-hydrolase, partial [Anaerolineales bacterium]|nr:MBL fold metallo-hydrolase [Anaerolineales bacterium]